MRDSGADALSQFLPMAVWQPSTHTVGVGDIGYRLVHGRVQLRRINDICLDEINRECARLDVLPLRCAAVVL